MVTMTRRHSKLLFFILIVLYCVYAFGLIVFPDYVVVDMSNPLVELYGLISAIIIIVSLYSHAFDKDIFNRSVIELVIINTVVCALWSYTDTALRDFELMSKFEILMFTSLYFLIYPPIISSMLDLRKKKA
ncbi:hypothetical protein PBPRB1400 [Photobacterium profundum SS9]|uniref:Uncharacterized protein n=1 Tax=Photobacterium profundum (strain SS9) TaxID=298386 RepID=Q6LHG3_PHOPR|nr:hypothetical protein PBPRB1400 [Photobacterium profundum SS9]